MKIEDHEKQVVGWVAFDDEQAAEKGELGGLERWIAEIDISVSKLLGFETFAKSLRVSVSVSENLV